MAKPQILLVDDEAPARELYSLYLSAKGYEVSSVGTPQEAISILGQKKFDLAILDLSLGTFNGLSLIEPIKENNPHIPIIVYTGRSLSDDLLMGAFSRGVAAVLSKTQSLSQLLDVIQKNLPAH